MLGTIHFSDEINMKECVERIKYTPKESQNQTN
jgi:hypothetical protein